MEVFLLVHMDVVLMFDKIICYFRGHDYLPVKFGIGNLAKASCCVRCGKVIYGEPQATYGGIDRARETYWK